MSFDGSTEVGDSQQQPDVRMTQQQPSRIIREARSRPTEPAAASPVSDEVPKIAAKAIPRRRT